MTIYQGRAPLTMVRLVDGGFRNVFEGEVVSGDAVEPEHLKRYLRKGFLVEHEGEKSEPEGVPAKSASKGDWEAYARSQGATDEDLDGKSKADLIDAYGAEQV